MRSTVRAPHLLLAIVVAAFITFYPQMDAAGYCGDGGCPEVSYQSPAGGGAISPGVSLVVATLVAVPGIILLRPARLALRVPAQDAFPSMVFPPETPPPRPSA